MRDRIRLGPREERVYIAMEKYICRVMGTLIEFLYKLEGIAIYRLIDIMVNVLLTNNVIELYTNTEW